MFFFGCCLYKHCLGYTHHIFPRIVLLTGVFLLKVATISANGEHEIGELLARAMEKVGKEGIITVSVSILYSSCQIFAFGRWLDSEI